MRWISPRATTPRSSGCSCVLGLAAHAQLVLAIGGERRARAVAMDAALFHLPEVREQVGEGDVGARGEPTHGGVKIVIGQRSQ